MTLTNKTVTVFGGTGFIGRQVVRKLAQLGMTIKVGTRHGSGAHFLQPSGNVGQITPIHCDYGDSESIRHLIAGSDYVVNCVGILTEKHKGDFDKLHADLPEQFAKIAKEEKVARFVHISALGADRSQARYARSKKHGEEKIQAAFPEATIMRPSVVFGPEDQFFNKFAAMARILPALPLIGGGHTRFQPVYVGDVAEAIVQALTMLAHGEKSPCGKIYELGGPEILTFKEIYERLFEATGRYRFLMPLPWPMAKTQAFFLALLPSPPLTPDQVELLKTDNVVSDKAHTLFELGIEPEGLNLIIGEYLTPYRKAGWTPDQSWYE